MMLMSCLSEINTDLNSCFHLFFCFFISIQEAVKTERRTNEGTFLTLMNLFLALFWKNKMLNRTDDAACGTNCGHFAQAELQRDQWGHTIDGCKLKLGKRDDVRLSFPA